MEDNLGVFKFNIAANDNKLQLSILHQINEAIVSAEKYEMLKEYYKTMVEKETEKIVLKRI
jgi:deoxyhypusine synthase